MIIDSLVETLRLEREVFQRQTPFTDFGIDSITAVEVIENINDRVGGKLRSTDIFNYPNIVSLAIRLGELGVQIKQDAPVLEDTELGVSEVESEYNSEEADPLLSCLNRLAAGELSIEATEKIVKEVTL